MNHAGIKMVAGLFAAIVLSSCAATDATPGNDKEQAIRDFVAVRQLAEIDRIRTDRNDSYQELDPHFLIYKSAQERIPGRIRARLLRTRRNDSRSGQALRRK